MNLKIRFNNNFFLMLLFLCFGVAQAQVPSILNNLVVTPINTGGMIQFTAPSSSGNSAITNYEYSTDDGASWTTPSPAVTESPLIISSGLTNCTTYQVKIRAVNATGSGVASVAENLTPRLSAALGSVWTLETAAENNSWSGVTYGNGLFVAVASTGTNRIMTSPDGITWTARTAPEASLWKSITYGNGLFVAVAYFGANRVMTSPDGINWTARTAPLSQWNSVTFGNGLYVAVSVDADVSTPKVMTSPDGINWTSRLATLNIPWYSVTFGNGLFVAVTTNPDSDPSKIMTSQDGINWISRYSPTFADTEYVSYGNGLFVASGSSYINIISSDGITWMEYSVGESYAPITYGNGMFVALSNGSTQSNKIKTSSNGSLWIKNNYADSNSWNSITYGNGIFVGVASTGNKRVLRSTYAIAPEIPTISSITPRNNGVRISIAPSSSVSYYAYSIDNGVNWINSYPSINSNAVILDINALTNNTSYPLQLKAINAGGASCPTSVINIIPASGTIPDAPTNLTVNSFDSSSSIEFKAPNNDGGSYITNYEYSLDNGTTWITPSPTIKESPLTISGMLTNCSSYQMKLRAVNEFGAGTASETSILVPKNASNPGNTWTTRTASESNIWSGVTYGNGVYVAVASSGTNRVMSSNDRINWTARMAVEANNWRSVCYGNGLFVAVAVDGMNRVMTSPDGVNWTPRNAAQSNTWNNITYGMGLFVAVASSGVNRVMTSPDGINWTARSSSQANNWNSVTYGNGVFVAVASSGTNRVMTSTNGTTWTNRSASQANSWNSVIYGNGLFVVVSASGTNRVMTSPNGTTWTNRTATEANSWNSITYGNGLFVAVASSGTNRMMTSTNGTNWTAKSIDANSWLSVIYGNVSFVAVAGIGTNSVITSTYSPVADAPVITSAPVSGTTATVAFTQSLPAFAPAITNYEYSTDNGTNWTALSPAATESPITITGLASVPSSIMIRAVNSVGNSCPSNNYSGCTPTSSTETITACDSYTWTANSQLYTSSGTYTSVSGCDTKTLELTIKAKPEAPTAVAQTFCSSATVADLTATGTGIQWYDVATDGIALATTTAIASGTYYVSKTLDTCESTRTAVSVTITPQPVEPTKVNCWDNFVFNTGTCSWDNTGTQDAEPTKVNSWDTFVFNIRTCSWDNTGTPTNSTTILDSLLGSTLPTINATITAYPVASATLYTFKIVTSGTNAIRYFRSRTNSFNLTQVSRTLFGTSYAISVAATIGGSLTAYGAAYIVTTPEPITKIQDSQCGQTLSLINTGIVATALTGVTNYRFKVVANGEERVLETVSRVFQLTSLVGGALYNTAYTISVAAQYNGVWRDYGAECIVRTPSGLAKIQDSQCGQTLSSLGYTIVAAAIPGVTNYRFKVVANGEERILESVVRAFRFTSVPGGVFFNNAYTISVATKYNGVWGDYGASCIVNTPAGLTKIQDSQCGTTLASLSTTIVANHVFNATNYRFKVVGNGVTRTIERTSRTFLLTLLPGGALNNTTYTVSVATRYNGVWGDYGTECTITTPSTITAKVAAQTTTAVAKEKVMTETSVLAYPSPFTTTFKLNFISSDTAAVAVAVYDMTGKQVENRNLTSSEINNFELGDNYPSGIYNVFVTQGASIKTLRVIKK